jgi:DNA-binding NarL/FixJ family response regulator
VLNLEEAKELQTRVVRILHVDDCEAWINVVRMHLDWHPNLHFVGVAWDGQEAVRKAEQLQPDLILLDVGLPLMNGIEVARQILKVAPKAAILYLSANSDPDVVEMALRTGGCGFVLKSEASRDLVTAIEAVLSGQRFVSTELLDYDDQT